MGVQTEGAKKSTCKYCIQRKNRHSKKGHRNTCG